MTFKVRIQILVDPSREIPSGVYYDETYRVNDPQWQNIRSAITQLETELISAGR